MTATNGSPELPADDRGDVNVDSHAAPEAPAPECVTTAADTSGVIEGGQAEHDSEGSPGNFAAPEEGRLFKKIKAFNRFIDETQQGLDPSAALVWLTLFRHAWDGHAGVSQSTIAKKMGVGTKTVQRGIEKLGALKLLKVTRHGGNGRGCHRYQLGLQPLPPRPKKPRPKKPR